MLGRGGMAEVRKGTDARLGRTVAVKRLRTDLASDPTFQARFRREAQSAASLNHPSIVSVYDTGEEMSSDGTNVAQPYIVMEYVAGRTLRDIIREGRKILPERALEITSGVLAALDYSHRAGIIHRDIKPGNVMLTPAGDVKVMDFGIARAMSDAHSTMTQTAAVVGTAQYLSREQARGESVDSRSDVYSTGCLLYELLTGRPPFVGESPVSVAYQHVREQAAPPSTLDDELEPEVDAIVMKALAKPLTERYQSAAAMKADIDRYLAGKPVQAPIPLLAGADDTTFLPADAPTNVAQPVGDQDDATEKRDRRVLILLVLVVLAILVAGLILLPKLLDNGPPQETVPALAGMTQTEAERALTDAGLRLGRVSEDTSPDVPAGQVMAQDPDAGERVDEKTEIDITVSEGKPQQEVPDLVGSNKDSAAEQLKSIGFRVSLEQRESDEPKDDVVAMDPTPGSQVADGFTVTLFFSDGPESVPDVVGKTEDQARKLIQDAGFEVSVVRDSTTKAKKGTVLDQSPQAGSKEDKGRTVTIVVSSFEPPSPSPSPTPSPSASGSPSPTPSPTPTPTPTPTP